jgi:hypothetical protein
LRPAAFGESIFGKMKPALRCGMTLTLNLALTLTLARAGGVWL